MEECTTWRSRGNTGRLAKKLWKGDLDVRVSMVLDGD
jgi:hypothetical protein